MLKWSPTVRIKNCFPRVVNFPELVIDLIRPKRWIVTGIASSIRELNVAMAVAEKEHQWSRALHLFFNMHEADLLPNSSTYNSALKAFEKGSLWRQALVALEETMKDDKYPHVIGFGATVLACSSSRNWQHASSMLEKLPVCSPELDLRQAEIVKAYSVLLMECRDLGFVSNQIHLLQKFGEAGIRFMKDADVELVGLDTAVDNAMAYCLVRDGSLAEAMEVLREIQQPTKASAALWQACGEHQQSSNVLAGLEKSRPPVGIPSRVPYMKEFHLLDYVLANSCPGDPASVCAAIERFSEEVLQASRLWLKIAGGTKAEVLTSAISRLAPHQEVLEIGTYCGYSCIRMALQVPGLRIISLEVDPIHAIIAQNVIALAGLTDTVEVLIGHSRSLLPRLATHSCRHKHSAFGAVFMDQRGSRYDDDIKAMECYGLIDSGTIIVADNVLKPGAPLFLWHVSRNHAYKTRIVPVSEFDMPSQDWMSVSACQRRPVADDAETPPRELVRLSQEANAMRDRATSPFGGVTFSEWAAFANKMREGLARFGIVEDADAFGKVSGGLAGAPWSTSLELISAMQVERLPIDVRACTTVICAYAEHSRWMDALALLQETQSQGAELDGVSWTAIISACSKTSEWSRALSLFSCADFSLAHHDAISYNVAVGACAKGRLWRIALSFLQEMCCLEMMPTISSYNAALRACVGSDVWQHALNLFCQISDATIEPNAASYNAILSCFAKATEWELALEMSSDMRNVGIPTNIITLSAVMTALSKGQHWSKALDLFKEAQTTGMVPDIVIIKNALSACRRGGCWEFALELLGELKLMSVSLSLTACGEAIAACATGRQWRATVGLLEEMLACRLKPDKNLSQKIIRAWGRTPFRDTMLPLIGDTSQIALASVGKDQEIDIRCSPS